MSIRNALVTTPRTGQFAGVSVSTNQEREGVFTRRPDGSWQQHTGTGQTPTFRSARHLAAWLRVHFGAVTVAVLAGTVWLLVVGLAADVAAKLAVLP